MRKCDVGPRKKKAEKGERGEIKGAIQVWVKKSI
jgi:hypothetical protein